MSLINPYLSAVPGAFSPSDITGLKAWHRPEGLSALSDNDPISSWSDDSGSGNAPTSSGTQRPTYKTGIVNGLAVARFDGGDLLTYTATPNAGASAGTLFLVHKIDVDPPASDVSTGAPMGHWGSHTDSDHMPYTDGNIYCGWGSNARKTVGNPASTMTVPRIYCMVSAASDWRIYIDGGTALFSTGTNTVAWNVGTPALGQDPILAQGAWLDGDISELIAYNSALSTTDLNRVGNYLETKYALTWTDI